MKKRAYPRVYRSYRPLKILLKILLYLLVVLIIGTVVLFFALRRYIRYTPDNTLYLEIPWLGYNVPETPEGEAETESTAETEGNVKPEGSVKPGNNAEQKDTAGPEGATHSPAPESEQ
ncbi:MAG TPA: hypothetical protein GXZ77_01405 [Papillibacter sp.]|jgi:cytoskeletal protein RodZ|nr:hypothetical protein [Papillibacter sp.]